MPNSKVHSLNLIIKNQKKSDRLLIIGPQPIKQNKLERKLKNLAPHHIFFIDGGLIHWDRLTKQQQKRAYSIGDGDSTGRTERTLDFLLPTQKNYSDLAFLLQKLRQRNATWAEIELIGFSSQKEEKRPDHLLMNIGEIYRLCAKLKIKIIMDEDFVFVPAGAQTLHYKGTFSLICLTRTKLRLIGRVHYDLPEWTTIAPLISRGLSNVAQGKFTIESNRPVLLYFAGKIFNS